ncbi:unnamed protein product, partial [Rotaria magnacalcarata]
QKENIVPKKQQQQQQHINEIQIDKLDNDIHFIQPIMSVPIEQQQPVMPKLLEQIDTIDPY